eukprot:gnl/MRDRNA2_/MRDRNA2_95829_c0_seq1.p1 gnl/MRDRNA2_/MRDRNA2_95829_c0~~gnl/MRDRNA2_/MRDRNA2_95829_c0_seq1.p1  ORF type:complete len:441 (-),score=68.99 gnl/MRDRNA2_/MRDRNA2_95829_c0_seq1:107-1258(-)
MAPKREGKGTNPGNKKIKKETQKVQSKQTDAKPSPKSKKSQVAATAEPSNESQDAEDEDATPEPPPWKEAEIPPYPDCEKHPEGRNRRKCNAHQHMLATPLKKYPPALQLKPGRKGDCFFHSQSDHMQDQYVFVKMGGKILQKTCRKQRWMRFTPYDDHTTRCKCVAPEETSSFGLKFLEIGATDGVYLSNTLFFESQMGWRGLCIEGSPDAYALLRQNRPGCVSLNAVIADPAKTSNVSTFYSFGTGKDVADGWRVGMSCMHGFGKCKTAEDAEKLATEMNTIVTTSTVPVHKLGDLFHKHGFTEVTYMSVDVEGAESTVLGTIDFTKIHGRTLVGVEGKSNWVKKVMEAANFTKVNSLEDKKRGWRTPPEQDTFYARISMT